MHTKILEPKRLRAFFAVPVDLGHDPGCHRRPSVFALLALLPARRQAVELNKGQAPELRLTQPEVNPSPAPEVAPGDAGV